MYRHDGPRFILFIALIMLAGCASTPYKYSAKEMLPNPVPLRPGEQQIERGRPHKFVDTTGSILGTPSKILLLNSQISNHSISEDTEKALSTYLGKNGLSDVKVRINQYAPGGEFKRLIRNKRVNPGWRYTAGVLSWLWYAAFPERIFAGIIGGDNYNPWTNTINIYSNAKPVALHEGGHAKFFAEREYPGFHGFLYMLPFANLIYEAKASNDALSYMKTEPQADDLKDGYKTLYPAYATYIGGNLADYVIASPLVYLGGGCSGSHNRPEQGRNGGRQRPIGCHCPPSRSCYKRRAISKGLQDGSS